MGFVGSVSEESGKRRRERGGGGGGTLSLLVASDHRPSSVSGGDAKHVPQGRCRFKQPAGEKNAWKSCRRRRWQRRMVTAPRAAYTGALYTNTQRGEEVGWGRWG